MKALLKKYITGKTLLILGFGLEGRSTYRLLRLYFPLLKLAVADKNTNLDRSGFENDTNLNFILGENYLGQIPLFDVVFKTPGIFNIAFYCNCMDYSYDSKDVHPS